MGPATDKHQAPTHRLKLYVDHICDTCHACCSIQKFPDKLIEQTSEDPPESIGISFAADVLKRSRQLIFVVYETVTSSTATCLK